MTAIQRVGFGFGYEPEMTARDMLQWVIELEKRDFELAFFSETIQSLRDAISTHAVFAINTSRIKLGCTQIVRLRTPLLMAQTFASLDELSHGRMVLSLGACTNSHARKNGLPPQNPAQTLREHTRLIRQYWTNAGGDVNFSGDTIQVSGEGLSIRPRRPKIPIWIAATSKTGLQIAGELGDGVLLNATTSPEYTRNAVEIVRKAATKAGRDPDELQVAGIIVAAVSDGKSYDDVRKELASKFVPLQVDFAVRPRMRVGEPYVTEELIEKLLKSYQEGGVEKLMRDIPDSVILGLTAVGKPGEVQERIEEYRKAGIQLPIVRPANSKVVKATLDAVTPSS
jgi:alkanesulfonate monooxygenase SsuD/methylene tetrahydromethanopterin reductase-like flavin-dependent oxidoreductase (luciferase family)